MHATDSQFTVSITSSINSFTSTVVFGCNPSSSNTFTAAFDAPAPPAPPAGVNSYFFAPQNSPSYYQNLEQDIVVDSGNNQYNLTVQSIDQTGTITLTWSQTLSNCYLETTSNSVLANMDSTTTYSFSATSGTTYNYYIIYNTQSYTINVNSSYGNPTANGAVAYDASYATSVTSPHTITSGTEQAVCTGYQIDADSPTAGTSYTFTNIIASHTIVYNWNVQWYVTAIGDSYSTITASTWQTAGTSPVYYYSTTSGSIAQVLADGIPIAVTSGTTSGSYTFTNIAAAHTIQIQYSPNLNLAAGWNLLSFPVTPSNTAFSSILPTGSYAYTWTGTAYSLSTTLTQGKAYWILVPSDTTLQIAGTPLTSYTATLTEGWNLISAVYGSNPTASSMLPAGYTCCCWTGTAYDNAPTLITGQGYWVFVSSSSSPTI